MLFGSRVQGLDEPYVEDIGLGYTKTHRRSRKRGRLRRRGCSTGTAVIIHLIMNTLEVMDQVA